jgi:hypothetical protein
MLPNQGSPQKNKASEDLQGVKEEAPGGFSLEATT